MGKIIFGGILLNHILIGKVDTYCYLVQRGKPCAMLPIQERYLLKVKEHIKKIYGLKIYNEKLSDGWLTLWIYKDDFMIEIIKSLPEKPKTIYDHWVLGKAFGYSDEAIKEFLSTKFS